MQKQFSIVRDFFSLKIKKKLQEKGFEEVSRMSNLLTSMFP